METTDFEDVLREAAGEAGVDADSISTTEFLTWRRYAKRRLEVAWRYHLWPDLGRCEQRYFRLPYSATATYNPAMAGVDNTANEVWWPLTGQYFVALQTTSGNPPTDASGVVDLAHWAVTSAYAIETALTGTQYNAPVNVLPFDLTAVYIQGQRTQYAGNIYQLFAVGPVTGVLPTDATQWGLVPPFDAYVPFEQSGQTAFSVVEECFSANPRTTTRGNTLNWFLSERGVQVLTSINYAWIQFRIRCPKLLGNVLDQTKGYSAGQQIYWSSTGTPGNFYTVTGNTNPGDTPDTAPGSFSVIQIPRMFHRYLVLGMAADWQKYVVGNNPEAEPQSAQAEGLAQMELDDLKSLYVGQMGQRVKTQVRTR